jgi:glycosyltransferase involved in cell wall biosynthesis
VKLSVIMPAHNEEATIEEVVRQVQAVDLDDIDLELIIVDDASTDSTPEKLAAIAAQPGVVVRTHPANRGKGAAIRTGLEAVTGDIVLIQDADLEYDPGDYPRLVAPIIEGRADVVYGSRFKGSIEGMAPLNLLANKLLAWAATILYGKAISDEATCYKVFRAPILKSFDLECERFEFCPEATAKAMRGGYRYVEVPISYTGRSVEAGKKIRAFDGLEAIWTLLRFRFKPLSKGGAA